MSITFASEIALPAQINWEQVNTDTLLTCQFDDGTTVTDLFTGITGVVFDVVNQIGSTGSNGYRVSATWTAKPANIDLDPFSLLQTQVTEDIEYYLHKPLDRSAGEAITLDVGTNYSTDFALRMACKANNAFNNGKPYFLGTTGQYTFGISSGTALKITLDWVAYTFTLAQTWYDSLAKYHDIVVDLKGGVLTASQNGVALAESFSGVTKGFICPSNFCDKDDEYFIKLFGFTCRDFPLDSRLWDFNQSIGATVVDHINGKLATLTNFNVADWQEITHTVISNINSNGLMDYASLNAFLTATTSTSVISHAKIFGANSDVGAITNPNQGADTNNRIKIVVSAGDNAFTGANFNTNYHFDDYYLRIRRYTDLTFKNIRGRKFLIGGYGVNNADYLVDTCMLLPDGTANALLTNSSSVTVTRTVKNSVLRGYRSEITTDGKITALNNIIINCSGYGASGYALTAEDFAQNNIHLLDASKAGYQSNGKGFQTGISGSNNISADDTAVLAGVGTQDVNLASYFTDPANDDLSINTAGKTAFLGQGWNGSDIVGWAYVTQTGAGTLTGFAISSVSFNGHIIDIARSTASLISAMTASASAVDVSKSNGTVKTSPVSNNGQIVAVDSLHGALALQVVIPGHVLTPKTIASAVLSAISASGLLNSPKETLGDSQLISSIAKASTTLITPTNSALILDAVKLGKTATIDYQHINVRSGSLIVQVLLSNEIIENLKSNQINI